ncbi:hypothetical protein CVT26_000702 [Gymnopilus dilepis]|uniref:Uncharacterized protein n=1 Tax=Gymnopilus dilepis TaxID=231916 RepID=A0A409WB75_9AGAR|nr:hypothetical protein CVT26_000702 [Gymnopilus dilepis]
MSNFSGAQGPAPLWKGSRNIVDYPADGIILITEARRLYMLNIVTWNYYFAHSSERQKQRKEAANCYKEACRTFDDLTSIECDDAVVDITSNLPDLEIVAFYDEMTDRIRRFLGLVAYHELELFKRFGSPGFRRNPELQKFIQDLQSTLEFTRDDGGPIGSGRLACWGFLFMFLNDVDGLAFDPYQNLRIDIDVNLLNTHLAAFCLTQAHGALDDLSDGFLWPRIGKNYLAKFKELKERIENTNDAFSRPEAADTWDLWWTHAFNEFRPSDADPVVSTQHIAGIFSDVGNKETFDQVTTPQTFTSDLPPATMSVPDTSTTDISSQLHQSRDQEATQSSSTSHHFSTTSDQISHPVDQVYMSGPSISTFVGTGYAYQTPHGLTTGEANQVDTLQHLYTERSTSISSLANAVVDLQASGQAFGWHGTAPVQQQSANWSAVSALSAHNHQIAASEPDLNASSDMASSVYGIGQAASEPGGTYSFTPSFRQFTIPDIGFDTSGTMAVAGPTSTLQPPRQTAPPTSQLAQQPMIPGATPQGLPDHQHPSQTVEEPSHDENQPSTSRTSQQLPPTPSTSQAVTVPGQKKNRGRPRKTEKPPLPFQELRWQLDRRPDRQ